MGEKRNISIYSVLSRSPSVLYQYSFNLVTLISKSAVVYVNDIIMRKAVYVYILITKQ